MLGQTQFRAVAQWAADAVPWGACRRAAEIAMICRNPPLERCPANPIVIAMGRRQLGVLALMAMTILPACGTTNGVRWAYGESSIYGKPDSNSESVGVRAIFGAPVILAGLAGDAVTLPFQLLFGVWPMWGDASTQLKPDSK